MTLSVRPLIGAEQRAALPDLARLRMAVFADWPYLYDGEEAYEAEYLREFMNAPDSVLIAAYDGDRIVGAATAMPIASQDEAFSAPLAKCGHDISALFYFGESVLLPDYRGRSIGHAFFDHREAHARSCGATAATFAAVIRPDDHPRRPADYVPLDAFWAKRGYARVPGCVTSLAWKEHDEAEESQKPMQFWLRAL